MSEDISATIRTGITVILVAALVATILSLMVVSQSILSNGLTTMQSGVDRVLAQEFEVYNGTTKKGTEVNSAISLFSGREVSIVVLTNANKTNGEDGDCYVYGALVSKAETPDQTLCQQVDGIAQGVGMNYSVSSTDVTRANSNDAYYTMSLNTVNGKVQMHGNTKGVTAKGTKTYIMPSGNFRCELIKDINGDTIGIMFTQISY